MAEMLVNVYRGELIESIHYGDIAVVNKEGELIASVGDSEKITYWRSAAKPLQVLPVIYSGAAEKYGFTEKELAVMAASHNGEEEHTQVVAGILEKIGLKEENLRCGIHPPYHQATARLIYRLGQEPKRLHNNCSGKHAAFLSLAQYYGWSIDDYEKPHHPLQQMLLKLIAEIADYPAEKIYLGVDGCGVVVFGLPLRNMAYAYARLANPESLPEKYREAAVKISRSMEKHPFMVAGSERFNTALMETTGDRLVAKLGAEGVFCVGVHGQMGIALKIADGNSRALPPAMLETLFQLGVLKEEELEELGKYYRPEVKNNHQAKVGYLEANFKLRLHNA